MSPDPRVQISLISFLFSLPYGSASLLNILITMENSRTSIQHKILSGSNGVIYLLLSLKCSWGENILLAKA